MSSTKDLVVSVYAQAVDGLKNKPSIDARAANLLFDKTSISQEDASYVTVSNSINSFETAVSDIISELSVAKEEFKLTDAQIKSAKMIAAVAAGGKASFEQILNPASIKDKKGQTVVAVESMGLEGYVTPDQVGAVVSQEAFDGQQLNNAIYFSIAYNIGASVQDEFGETLFPTIAVSPTESGISVSVEFVAIANEYLRNKSGKPVDGSDPDDRIAVIKAIYDNEIFGVDTTALIPVYRDNDAENMANFVADGKYTDDKTTGKPIVTAPLKFDTAIDLLGISQTDDILAKGNMDNTDAVDRAVSLKTVYFTMKGAQGTEADELFAYDVTAVDGRRFFPASAVEGHYKGLRCNFKANGISINTSNTKKADGNASTNLASLAGNYNIFLQFNISGDLNTDSGVVDLTAGSVRLVAVRNAAGELVDKNDVEYKKIEKAVGAAKLVGYVLDAKRTNSNVRTRGIIVSNEIFSYLYTVPFRSGVTCIKSLVNYSGTENDANRIAAQSQTTGFIISNIAVKTLVDHVDSLRSLSDNGALGAFKFGGIGRKFIKPYFRQENVNLSDVVDSLESNKRDDDIRSNILQRVNNIAMDMIINSNYGPAFKVLKGNSGQKIKIVIATDPNIARLIVRGGESEFAYGDRFTFVVVSTYNNLMKDKIVVVPTVLDANKNTTPDPLNFGFCAYTPTIVYEVSKTTNGAVAGELNTIPRFLHVVNLPIAGLINVSGVAEAFSKIALWTAPKARA